MSDKSPFYSLGMAVFMLMNCWCTAATLAHQFEDGYVERTVAIRIRDRVGTVEYSIGLNDATIKLFSNAWPQDAELFAQLQKASSTQPADQEPAAPEPNTRSPVESNLPQDGSLTNEIALIRAFAKLSTPHLESGLRIVANGKRLKLSLISATPSARHHATLQTSWQFHLPADPTIKLQVRDTNFLQQPGGIKYSLKTSGSSMTIQSNAAPILIRSARIELDQLDVLQRLQQRGIVARIRVVQPSEIE